MILIGRQTTSPHLQNIDLESLRWDVIILQHFSDKTHARLHLYTTQGVVIHGVWKMATVIVYCCDF